MKVATAAATAALQNFLNTDKSQGSTLNIPSTSSTSNNVNTDPLAANSTEFYNVSEKYEDFDEWWDDIVGC